MCNFEGLKLNKIPELSNQINENEAQRSILLEQEGVIIKYWAEHPDAEDLDFLSREYRKECARAYREANKCEMSEVDTSSLPTMTKGDLPF